MKESNALALGRRDLVQQDHRAANLGDHQHAQLRRGHPVGLGCGPQGEAEGFRTVPANADRPQRRRVDVHRDDIAGRVHAGDGVDPNYLDHGLRNASLRDRQLVCGRQRLGLLHGLDRGVDAQRPVVFVLLRADENDATGCVCESRHVLGELALLRWLLPALEIERAGLAACARRREISGSENRFEEGHGAPSVPPALSRVQKAGRASAGERS